MSNNILLAGCGDQAHQVLGMLLSRNGFEVHSTTNVNEALGGLWSQPALIVVDLAMDHSKGLEVIKSARAYGLKAELAVVSSGDEAENRGWISKYQPDAIFGKPFDFQDFVDWMSQFDVRNVVFPSDALEKAA